jgi:hypothetical protein
MVCVVGTRTGFWVVLNAKDWFLTMGDSRDSSIVEIQMGDINLIGRQGLRIQSEPMILARDLHLTGGTARMVQASMAISELEGGSPQGQTQNLMPQADTKQREVGLLQEILGQSNSLGHSRRITRPIREKDPIGLMGANRCNVAVCWQNRDLATMGHKTFENRSLNPKIDRNHLERPIGFVF